MPKSKPEKAKPRTPEIAKKAGGIFVFATADATLPNKENVSAELSEYRYTNHSCKKCNSQVAMPKLKDGSPFCVVCGHDEVVAGAELSKMSIPADNELSYLTCASCGILNTFPLALVTAGHGVHCAACGNGMHKATSDFDGIGETTDDLEVDIPSVDDLALMDTSDDSEELDLDTVAATDDDSEDKDAGDEEDEGDDAEDEDDKKAEAGPEDNFGDKKAAPFGKGGKAEDKDEDDDKADDKDGDDDKAESAVDATADADEVMNNDYVDMDLVDVDETPIASIAFFYNKDRVLLESNNQIIASLKEEDAKAFKGMLSTQQFQMSVAHAIEKVGLKKAVIAHGFTLARIKVPVTKVVATKVEAQLTKRKSEVATTSDNYRAHFGQCVDIAAAGYAGNHWRNRQDPVKTALVSELNGLGIKKAEKIIDKIFASYSVAQFRDVLEVARDLESKPVEVLNSLAETIDLVKYKPFAVKAQAEIAEDDATDEDDDEDSDDSSMEFSTASPVDLNVETSGASSKYRTKELSSILGNKPVFNC